MNRRAHLAGRVILISLCLSLCLACAGLTYLQMYLWVNACLPWECVPDRGFPVEVLLIDETVFPAGWQPDVTGPNPPPNAPLGHYNSIERIELFFLAPGGGAFQEIHRFASVRGAVREFNRQRSLSFPSSEAWTAPDELSYQSPAADQFYLACRIDDGTPTMCGAIWRYEEYFVRFNTHMPPDFMTYADLGRILRAIDERMVFYLKENGE